MVKNIKNAILSGIMIAFGCSVYLSCVDKGLGWLGAFLFSAGLFTICEYSFNLYTGKVGYIAFRFKDLKYLRLVLLILFFNLLTTFILGILISQNFEAVRTVALNVYSAKFQMPLWKLFLSGVLCGILMYLAVDTWKRGAKIGCFIYVPLFILCGFDHSIANSFYNGAALSEHTFTLQNLVIVLIVILGNAVGGMLVPLLTRTWEKSE
ncbi:MAG: formate/nitrite transporter family protein [Treponema sp.]